MINPKTYLEFLRTSKLVFKKIFKWKVDQFRYMWEDVVIVA